MAWFVPLEFGFAGVVSALAIPVLERRFGDGAPPEWSSWERWREVPVLAGLYLVSVGANGSEAWVFLGGLIVALAARLVMAGVHGDWAFALVAALAGPAVEASIHSLGAFDYTEPDFLGLPIWLPALWAWGGLAIRRLFGPLGPIGRSRPMSERHGARSI